MRILAPASNRQIDLGLLAIRAAVGSVFIAHGAQKLFTFGLDGVAGAFGGMGVPFAGVVGPAVAFLEFFGGIALVLGLLTRVAGLGLAANMLGAILLVHLPAGFFMPNGYEFAMTLLATSIALVFTGAGAFSVDNVLARSLAKRNQATAPQAVGHAFNSEIQSRRIA